MSESMEGRARQLSQEEKCSVAIEGSSVRLKRPPSIPLAPRKNSSGLTRRKGTAGIRETIKTQMIGAHFMRSELFKHS